MAFSRALRLGSVDQVSYWVEPQGGLSLGGEDCLDLVLFASRKTIALLTADIEYLRQLRLHMEEKLIGEDTQSIREAYSKVKKICKAIQIVCGISLMCFLFAWALLVMTTIFGAVTEPSPQSIAQAAYCFIFGIIVVAMIWIAFRIFSDAVHGESPFVPKQIRRIRIASLLLIVLVFVEALTLFDFSSGVVVSNLDIGFVRVGGEEQHSIEINAGALFLSIVLYCVSVVFEYGVLLQRFTDETL